MTDSRRTRPRPAPTPGTDEAAERRLRAVTEPLDFSVRETSPVLTLVVRNPLHGTQYLAYLPEHPARTGALCTCPDFARRGVEACKHLEGAFRWIAEHPDREERPRTVATDPYALWAEVDRRRDRARPEAPSGRSLREAGAVLYESKAPA